MEKHLSLPSWILIRRKFQFHFNNFSSQPGILVDMTLRGFSPSSPRFCSYKLTWKREKNYEYEFQPSMTHCWRRGWLRTSDLAEKRDPSTSPECLYRLRTFQPVDGLTGWRCRVWIGVKRNGKLLESENSWSVSHVKLFLSTFPFLTYNWKILKKQQNDIAPTSKQSLSGKQPLVKTSGNTTARVMIMLTSTTARDLFGPTCQRRNPLWLILPQRIQQWGADRVRLRCTFLDEVFGWVSLFLVLF